MPCSALHLLFCSALLCRTLCYSVLYGMPALGCSALLSSHLSACSALHSIFRSARSTLHSVQYLIINTPVRAASSVEYGMRPQYSENRNEESEYSCSIVTGNIVIPLVAQYFRIFIRLVFCEVVMPDIPASSIAFYFKTSLGRVFYRTVILVKVTSSCEVNVI